MGTTGSMIPDKNVEMNIDIGIDDSDSGNQIKSRRLVKKTTSSFLSLSRPGKNKTTEGMHPSVSLNSIDVPRTSPHLLTVPPDEKARLRKENELKLMMEQDLQANKAKIQKLEVELNRLRAELQAQNKQCQKLRAERDAAIESSYEATERAISLEQDREKIQRQFKIFRETKESEIQALLQEKRKSESQLQKLQAYGFATGNEKGLANNEVAKPHTMSDSPGQSQHCWWGVSESEDASLFGSYSQIRNNIGESLQDMQSDILQEQRGNGVASSLDSKINSPQFGSGMIPEYSPGECYEKNFLRVYVTGTPDCLEEVNSFVSSPKLKELTRNCEKEGYFLSIINFENIINAMQTVTSPCKLVSSEEVISNGIQMSSLFICFLGNEIGKFTDLECHAGHLDCVGWRSAVICVPEKASNRRKPASTDLLNALEASKCRQFHKYYSISEGIDCALNAVVRAVRLELGVTEEGQEDDEEIGCLNEMPLDEMIEQQQKEIASTNDKVKTVGCEKYYDRLNELLSSHGPAPPLLISGGDGSGKTSLMRSWLEHVPMLHKNTLVFQHFVSSKESVTSDPVTAMRRLLYQICSHLPVFAAPPAFSMSMFDVAQLQTALPRWLERLYNFSNKKIVLAVDSIDLIENATEHFSWLKDPLPVGVRVVISVGADSCPGSWRLWPTLHLEPLSMQSVQAVSSLQADNYEIQLPSQWENEVLNQCRTASTCHPLYVTLLFRVACSTCQSHGKEPFFRSCLKTRDSVELYRLVLQYIENETVDSEKQHLKQILQFVTSAREGLTECELRQMIPTMQSMSWVCMRSILLHFCFLEERAGLLCCHNSLVHNLLTDIYTSDKAFEKSSIRAMVQWFADQTECDVTPRVAEVLPWLMKRGKYEQGLRECLSHPSILLHLYKKGRANEIVSYWQYLQTDKEEIKVLYIKILRTLSNPKSSGSYSPASNKLRRPDSGSRHNTVITRKKKSFINSQDAAVTNVVLAELYEVIGRFFQDLGLMEEAISKVQRSLEIREGEFDPDHPLAANSLHYLASVYAKWQKYNMAEPLYRQSLEIVESLADKGHPRVCQEMQSLAYVLHKQDKREQAASLHKKVQALQGRNTFVPNFRMDRIRKQTLKLDELTLGVESISLARNINQLGVLYYFQKNYSSAESFLLRGLEMREKLHGENHMDVAQSLHNLAAMYNEQKLFEKAIDCMTKCLHIRRELVGDSHPLVSSTLKHLAILHKKVKDYDKALTIYKELLTISENINGVESSVTASIMVNLGIVQCKLDNHDKALPLYEQAISIYSHELGGDSKQVADTLKNIAVLRYEKGEFEKAAALYKKSMQIKENLKTKNSLQWH